MDKGCGDFLLEWSHQIYTKIDWISILLVEGCNIQIKLQQNSYFIFVHELHAGLAFFPPVIFFPVYIIDFWSLNNEITNAKPLRVTHVLYNVFLLKNIPLMLFHIYVNNVSDRQITLDCPEVQCIQLKWYHNIFCGFHFSNTPLKLELNEVILCVLSNSFSWKQITCLHPYGWLSYQSVSVWNLTHNQPVGACTLQRRIIFLYRNTVLITYGLFSADRESQYIIFLFYADCKDGTEGATHMLGTVLLHKWLQKKCLLKLPW